MSAPGVALDRASVVEFLTSVGHSTDDANARIDRYLEVNERGITESNWDDEATSACRLLPI